MTIRLMPTFSPKSRRPGRCSVSGSGQQHTNRTDPRSPLEPVVDLDTWIEHEGNLEITLDTAREIGSVVGMLPAEQAESLQARVLDLEGRFYELQREYDDKAAAVTTLAGELADAGRRAAELAPHAQERGYAQGYAQAEADCAVTPEIP
jgi:hypothetical protein